MIQFSKVRIGLPAPPKPARTKVFSEGYEHRNRWYPSKELSVFYVEEDWGTTVVTVIVRYGDWER